MSFPDDLDFDAVMSQTLQRVTKALGTWAESAPVTEEPLMSRLAEHFLKRVRCDVGSRSPMTMTSRLAFLHRRGTDLTARDSKDTFGADLAITIDIARIGFRKTAFFQLKVSDDFAFQLEKHQLQDAARDAQILARSFVFTADKKRQRVRIKPVSDCLTSFNPNAETLSGNCSNWPSLAQWLAAWMACDIGESSDPNDKAAIETRLESYIVERPPGWKSPWGDHGEPFEEGFVPAKAWLEMFFAPARELG